MLPRRLRSGEVVNATLMEVFVVLCFMFMVYTTMVRAEADQMAQKLGDYPEMLKQCIADLDGCKEELEHWRSVAAACKLERDEATGQAKACEDRFRAMWPPYCDPYAEGEGIYGVVRLLPGGAVDVDIPKAWRPGVDFQGSQTIPSGGFSSTFAALRAATRESRCRLAVEVIDESGNLQDYKSALRQVEDVFYTKGELD